jgi:hypothetical protein
MTTQDTRPGAKAKAPVMHVTTNTGRILRVTPAEAAASPLDAPTVPGSRTGSQSVTVDPARRTDVLFRVRRDEGHELSSWWMIGAFVVTSGLVIALLSWVPGSA